MYSIIVCMLGTQLPSHLGYLIVRKAGLVQNRTATYGSIYLDDLDLSITLIYLGNLDLSR